MRLATVHLVPGAKGDPSDKGSLVVLEWGVLPESDPAPGHGVGVCRHSSVPGPEASETSGDWAGGGHWRQGSLLSADGAALAGAQRCE